MNDTILKERKKTIRKEGRKPGRKDGQKGGKLKGKNKEIKDHKKGKEGKGYGGEKRIERIEMK